METPLLEDGEGEAFVLEDATGRLKEGECYLSRRGRVATGTVRVLNLQTGEELALSAQPLHALRLPPEATASDSAVLVVPAGILQSGSTVFVQMRQNGQSRPRAKPEPHPDEAKLAPLGHECVIIKGPCAEALPVAVALPPIVPGSLALRKGAAWLLGLSVAQLCLLSPISSPAAFLGVLAAAITLCAADGGTRAASRIKKLSTASACFTALAIVVTSFTFASIMPVAVRRMVHVCDPPPAAKEQGGPQVFPLASSSMSTSRAYARDETRSQGWYGLPGIERFRAVYQQNKDELDEALWSSVASAGFNSFFAPSQEPGAVGPFLVFTTTTSDGRSLGESNARHDSQASSTDSIDAVGEGRELDELEGVGVNLNPTAASRDACVKSLRIVWILIGLAFVLVVVGLQLGALIAAGYVARESACLVRHGPVDAQPIAHASETAV